MEYLGQVLRFLSCGACGSDYLHPMPSDAMLDVLYGPEYQSSFEADPAIEDPKEPQLVAEWLSRHPRGVLVDFGCGSGAVLAQASALGWEVIGVERDAVVAAAVAKATGARVVSRLEELGTSFADVIHLGDVIEHLTRVDEQLPPVLRLLKPRGTLLAQGPLEAEPSVFNYCIRAGRHLRGGPTSRSAPYHVILATSRGQRLFFQRFGLEERAFRSWEVSWPAPSRLSGPDLRSPRRVALFVLRRVSQVVTALFPRFGNNRFFYAGDLRS
jgi:SAM-dependent methyltransferase